MVSQFFLNASTLYVVTAEATELNNSKKSEKDVVYFQLEENLKTSIAKSEKVLKKHDLKITFLFNCLG